MIADSHTTNRSRLVAYALRSAQACEDINLINPCHCHSSVYELFSLTLKPINIHLIYSHLLLFQQELLGSDVIKMVASFLRLNH